MSAPPICLHDVERVCTKKKDNLTLPTLRKRLNQNFPSHFKHTKLRDGAYRQMFVGQSVLLVAKNPSPRQVTFH
jgi:hypothetical protein